MDGKLFTDSALDVAARFTDFDRLMEMMVNKGKQGVKRKMNQNDNKKKKNKSKNYTFSDLNGGSGTKQAKAKCELKENYPHTEFIDEKRIRKKKSFKKNSNRMPNSHQISRINEQNNSKNGMGLDSTDAFKEMRKKKVLQVYCGKMAGSLYRTKYEKGEQCILCKGQWFTPWQFEKFGGKANSKKWKRSIHCKLSNDPRPVQLMKLIKNDCLSEFGHLRESPQQGAQTEGDSATTARNETVNCGLMSSLKDIPPSVRSMFSKTLEVTVCRNKEQILQKETIQTDDSSDESKSVAERVKMNRRESVTSTEAATKMTSQPVESTNNDKVNKDAPAHPPDAPEPAVPSVMEKAIQTTEEVTAPLSLTSPPAEWQNPIEPVETRETGQMQLFEFLAKQFNTINDTLKSIDTSLKKLVEKQSHDSLPESNRGIPALQEHPQVNCLVKQE
ncbi:uncharacterized protein si:dkey-68o6.5 [Danio rerio]|uniref:Si:dkey-68o6.5 n=2 Tax=Danio rerio TaxID=7955 RepID=A0A0R4ICN1_DANRE|nr:uncharacterized protein si:dkey-68o6.5 [Danio rerio]|eukprot:XP_703053.1 uncharacterized protein si:dkey-68o6.5 [Danio rerio]